MVKVLVVTNCTSRKRGGAAPITLTGHESDEHCVALAVRWRATVEAAPRTHPVRNLYLGRSFSSIYQAARTVDGELYVASAGLGLVHELDEAPCYDLTFADPTNPLARVMSVACFAPSDWWSAICGVGVGNGTLATVVQKVNPSRVLVAMPSGYLEMVRNDLESLPSTLLERFRIVSSTAGVTVLGARARLQALPYDERLEAIAGYAGTRTDFPHRALLHFVTELNGHHLSLAAAKDAVSCALAGHLPRHIPTRTRLDDSEIAALLRRHWADHKGNSSNLLRFLRREAQVACEQSRFRDIWRSVKVEMQAKAATA
jgi:hypothetical protein